MNLPISLPQEAVSLLRLRTSTNDLHGEVHCYLVWCDRLHEIHETEIELAQMVALSKYLNDEGLQLPLTVHP